MLCKTAAVDWTGTNDCDLGTITVCHATRIIPWFGDSGRRHTSFATTILVSSSLSHRIALL